MATAACSSSNNWGHMGRHLDSSYLAHGSIRDLRDGAIIPFCKERGKFRPCPVYVFQHKGGMGEKHKTPFIITVTEAGWTEHNVLAAKKVGGRAGLLTAVISPAMDCVEKH